MQGNEQFQELDKLGAQLSKEISCPVHFPAFGKNMFECQCGIVFPVYLVKSGNWDEVRKKHNNGEVPQLDIATGKLVYESGVEEDWREL